MLDCFQKVFDPQQYIASKDTDGKYPGYDRTRKDYRPTEGVIGHSFDPNVLIAIKNGLPRGIYTFYGGWGKTDIGEKNNENSGTAALDSVLDSTDNYKTKQVIGDDRPENVIVPEPDHQTMYAFYQGEQYDIKLVLNYVLNEDYDPHKTANSCAGESEALQESVESAKKRNSDWFMPSLTLALVSIVFVVFLLISWRHSRSAEKKRSTRSLRRNKAKK